MAFERRSETERLLCVFNPSPRTVRAAVPGMPAEGVGYRVEGGEVVFEGWGGAFLALPSP